MTRIEKEFLEEYRAQPVEIREMVDSIIRTAAKIQKLLDEEKNERSWQNGLPQNPHKNPHGHEKNPHGRLRQVATGCNKENRKSLVAQAFPAIAHDK